MSSLQTIDLFSGAGGLSLGLEQAGFSPMFAVEKNHHAASTYRKNFPDTDVHTGDIKQVCFKRFSGEVDLVAGGPPCQPFSVAGAQLSFNDPRDMIPEFIRVVREVKPAAFLLENVAGLSSRRHTSYLSGVIRGLESLGYFVNSKVHNAADFGVPQDRLRLIVVGTRKPDFKFPKASYGPGGRYEYVSAKKAIEGAPEDEPNNAIITYAKKPVLRPSPFAGMLVNGGGRPINLDSPSQTIPASAGGNRTHIVDRERILVKYHHHLMNGGKPRTGLVDGVRRLTVKESARIQTFPDKFDFTGTRSAQYAQVGNAVPPKLAKSVGSRIRKYLEQEIA